jgi:hypothetical protein
MSRIVSPVELDNVLAISQRRAKAHGISVTFDEYADTASTDGRNITLPIIHNPVTQEQMDVLYGYIIHECGHLNRPDVFKILKDHKPPAWLCYLFNVIEDHTMERETASHWPGDHKALSVCNDILVGRMDKTVREQIAAPSVPWDRADNGPLASFFLQWYARMEWDDRARVTVECLHRELPDVPKDLVDELLGEGWVDKLKACDTVEDSWNVACDLGKRLYPEREDEIEASREAVMGEGKGGSGEEGETDGEPTSNPDFEGYNINWKDVVMSDHEAEGDTDPGGGVGIEWTDYNGKDKVAFMPTNLIKVWDAKEKAATHRSYTASKWKDYMSSDANARHLSNQMRRYLQSQRRVHPRRHRDMGRLDKSSLVKLGLPPIDGGEYNRKIFYDLTHRQIMDTSVSLLVDWSGSMNGKKARMAADAAGRLVEVLDKQLHMPVEVLSFSVCTSECDMAVIKAFNDKQCTREDIAKRFHWFLTKMGGNNDSDALHFAYQRLARRRETRRILIVLSDGAPTDTYPRCEGNADTNLRYICNYIQDKTPIELWGIGLEDTTVRRYYKLNTVIKDSKEINTHLMAIIKHGYERRK